MIKGLRKLEKISRDQKSKSYVVTEDGEDEDSMACLENKMILTMFGSEKATLARSTRSQTSKLGHFSRGPKGDQRTKIQLRRMAQGQGQGSAKGHWTVSSAG